MITSVTPHGPRIDRSAHVVGTSDIPVVSDHGVCPAELAPGRAGVTCLPWECGLLARALVDRSELLRSVQRRLLELVRLELYGRGVGTAIKPCSRNAIHG